MNGIGGFREAGQQFLAAAWETAHATVGSDDAAGMGEFLNVVEQIGSQLAGLRLNTIDQARFLTGAAQILDSVMSSVADTSGRLRGHIRLATTLAEELPLIQAALQEGLISMPQAAAIADGLATLPAGFGAAERERCQIEILKHADSLGPAELRTLAARLVEYVDPEGAEAAEAARLAAEERRARRRRRLRLTPDHHGAMTISGKLPLADGALLAAQLEALMPPLASYQQAGDLPDRQARTADALMLLVQIAANSGDLPNQGMDRPHIVLTMDHNTLASGLGHITLPEHRTGPPSDSTPTGTTTPRQGNEIQGRTMPTPRPRCRGGPTSPRHSSTTTGTTTNPSTAPSAQHQHPRPRPYPSTPATPTPGTPP